MTVAPSAPETPSGGTAVQAEAPAGATAVQVQPSLEQARALGARHNLIPLCHSFIADCETPVSAFLKLRGIDPAQPAFLLESAEQGQRMGRYSFIGLRPRSVLRWSLADGGDPYALAAAEVARYRQAPLADGAAGGTPGRGRPGLLHSWVARSATSATTSCAPSSRSGSPIRTSWTCRTWR